MYPIDERWKGTLVEHLGIRFVEAGPDQSTATLESKTNFFAAARSGVVRAEAKPIHKGRRTHVWETRVTDQAGKLLSLTIQTQMIL